MITVPPFVRPAAVAAVLAALAALAFLAPALAGSRTAAGTGPAAAVQRAAEVIVQVRPGSPARAVRAAVRELGGRVSSRTLPIINGFGARVTPAAAQALRARPDVRAVSLDGPVEHRQIIPTTALRTAFPPAVQADKVWNASNPATGRGVGVAVIDSGIDGGLPDFRVSRSDTRSRVIASAVVNPRATTADDGNGHGTHVAGLIAGNGAARDAADPLAGQYIGVAPEANLISVKVSDDNGATTVLDVLYGLQFVLDHRARYGIRVVNLSLSSVVAESAKTDPLDAAVESVWFHGIVVVAAAGNSGGAADAVSYAPGNDPWVISVGATDDAGTRVFGDDTVAPWSSRGLTQDGYAKPDVLAPGAHLVSTLAPGSAFQSLCPACLRDGSYFAVGGTSMAAAVVSGVVADLLQVHPGWTPDQVKGALLNTGPTPTGSTVRAARLLNALGAGSGQLVSNVGVPVSTAIDPATGDVRQDAASWRAASWRDATGSELAAGWAAASWRCDCSLQSDGSVDPAYASWRSASWRKNSDFSK
jgi:serine protease AprX